VSNLPDNRCMGAQASSCILSVRFAMHVSKVTACLLPDTAVQVGWCHSCREDPLLEIAVELEKIATQDEYFVKRGLYPNVRGRCCTLGVRDA
jgi:hypothetical protein